MATKTRTITRYRTRTRTRTRRNRTGVLGGRKVSLAVAGGALRGLWWCAYGAINGNYELTARRLMLAYTGYDYVNKVWQPQWLGYGLYWLIGGYALHKVAGIVGLNSWLKRWRLPVEI